MFPIIILLIVFVFLLWSWKDTRRPKGYPPGPPLWPFFGNLLQVVWRNRAGKQKYKIFKDFSETYGDVVSLRIVRDHLVIVSGKETIKEVMRRDEFNGRPDGFIFLYRSYGEKLGIVFSEGDLWSQQRRFALRILRDFGFGKTAMELAMSEEISELIESIKRNGSSKPLEITKMFTFHVINILWVFVAGKRFSSNDKKLQRLFDLTVKMFKALESGGGILNQFTWFRHIFPESSGFKDIDQHTTAIHNFIDELIDDHMQNLNPEEPKDFIDAYLIEMKKSEGQDTTFYRKQLMTLCDDFFDAGSETTSNSLAFFVLYMVRYPEVQKKIQKEIDAVIGRNQQPTLADRFNMPYTEAAIMETMRLSPVTPLLVPHRARTTTQLNNFTIEKGSTILISAYSLHMDSYWKDPLVFRPERFLGNDGKVIQDDNLLPFGTGKRRCVGETLAKSTVFFFIAALLQQFDLSSPENEPPPIFESVDGFTQSPAPFKALFKLRKG